MSRKDKHESMYPGSFSMSTQEFEADGAMWKMEHIFIEGQKIQIKMYVKKSFLWFKWWSPTTEYKMDFDWDLHNGEQNGKA